MSSKHENRMWAHYSDSYCSWLKIYLSYKRRANDKSLPSVFREFGRQGENQCEKRLNDIRNKFPNQSKVFDRMDAEAGRHQEIQEE